MLDICLTTTELHLNPWKYFFKILPQFLWIYTHKKIWYVIWSFSIFIFFRSLCIVIFVSIHYNISLEFVFNLFGMDFDLWWIRQQAVYNFTISICYFYNSTEVHMLSDYSCVYLLACHLSPIFYVSLYIINPPNTWLYSAATLPAISQVALQATVVCLALLCISGLVLSQCCTV